KSKPALPSFASMRAENSPPSRRSTALRVVCHVSWGVFHCTMSSGLFQTLQTWFGWAFTTVSTVIFMAAFLDIGCGYEVAERDWRHSTAAHKNIAVDLRGSGATSFHASNRPNSSPDHGDRSRKLLAVRTIRWARRFQPDARRSPGHLTVRRPPYTRRCVTAIRCREPGVRHSRNPRQRSNFLGAVFSYAVFSASSTPCQSSFGASNHSPTHALLPYLGT